MQSGYARTRAIASSLHPEVLHPCPPSTPSPGHPADYGTPATRPACSFRALLTREQPHDGRSTTRSPITSPHALRGPPVTRSSSSHASVGGRRCHVTPRGGLLPYHPTSPPNDRPRLRQLPDLQYLHGVSSLPDQDQTVSVSLPGVRVTLVRGEGTRVHF